MTLWHIVLSHRSLPANCNSSVVIAVDIRTNNVMYDGLDLDVDCLEVKMTSVSTPRDGSAAAPQQQHQEEKPRIDSFTLFSDDTRRMNKILLKGKDKDNNFDMVTLQSYVDSYMAQQQSASKRRRSNNSKSIKQGERRTRLSFEAHPRLMLSSDESDNNEDDDDSYEDITGRSRVSLEDPKKKVD